MAFQAKDPSKGSGIKVKSSSDSSKKEDDNSNQSTRKKVKPLAQKNKKDSEEKEDTTSRNRVNSINRNTNKNTSTEEEEKKATPSLLENKKIVIGGGIVAIMVVSNLGNKSNNSNQSQYAQQQTQAQQEVVEAPKPTDEELLKQELINQGLGANSVSQSNNMYNNTSVSSDNFVTSLVGVDIPENYEVKAITYVIEFIPYTKHRAVTGTGVELYWLEGTFQGQPCKFTIPYKYFKDLPESGAVPCNVEIVQTSNGDLVATWFQFSADSYSQITK